MQKIYQLQGCKFSLERERDGAGNSGPAWSLFNSEESIKREKYVWVKDIKRGEIRIGCGIRVGSITSGSWWQCTGVTEILDTSDVDENGEYEWVKFMTGNSTYTATGF